jgi:hypothetical protein
MKGSAFLLVILSAATAFAQNLGAQSLTIDATKPYVYLKFDHIGPRQPVQKGEGDTASG